MLHQRELTEVVIGSWILGAGEPQIPTSHGVLDRAMKKAIENGAFGQWSNELHFVDSRIGLQCAELPSIIDWAQLTQLTSAPNPSYQYAQIQVGERSARAMLHELNVDVEDAKRWGKMMTDAVQEVRSQMESFENDCVEGS